MEFEVDDIVIYNDAEYRVIDIFVDMLQIVRDVPFYRPSLLVDSSEVIYFCG